MNVCRNSPWSTRRQSVAPLPVVRLYFVGRGRAGKTTTLRRLKGESFRDDEPSTHGLDVWAGQVEADLQADSEANGPMEKMGGIDVPQCLEGHMFIWPACASIMKHSCFLV